MDQRLQRLEQAVAELQAENARLRRDLNEIKEHLVQNKAAAVVENVEATDQEIRSRFKSRWTYVILVVCIVVVPVVALTLWHANAVTSTIIGAVNALIVYFIGPGAVRLLIEGLLRAIPGVLLGQTARITVDNMRKKRAR